MSRVIFNSNAIRNNIVTSLRNSTGNMSSAIHSASGLSMPYPISASGEISSIASQISEIRNEVNEISSWLDRTINTLNRSFENSVDNVNNTVISKVPRQSNIVAKM